MAMQPFGEVIESSLTNWLVQSWQWDLFPSFGSLVTITAPQRTIIGVVYQIHTGSMDPMRYPFAYKKTEEQLRREQPQIFEFLKTTLSCLTVGYQDHQVYYQLAPEPPKIHAFAHSASNFLYRDFFNDHHYLHLLFSNTSLSVPIDELLLAMLYIRNQHYPCDMHYIQNFAQTFSLLTGNDYRRLKLFLKRAQSFIT
jgi:hypothetical protein